MLKGLTLKEHNESDQLTKNCSNQSTPDKT